MTKFLTGNELNAEIEKIFEKAKSTLILISPYIKLHERIESSLKSKINNPKLKIIIVFGKNEENLSKSMRIEDLNFFKEFPNIEICYEKRLHAKYFANESSEIITSMNLHSYSQDNNIEAGILMRPNYLSYIATAFFHGKKTIDTQASNYFKRVIEQSEIIYLRKPVYIKKFFAKKHIKSEPEIDRINDFFNSIKVPSNDKSKTDFAKEIKVKNCQDQYMTNGFCIRTGEKIKFNVNMPFTNDAFENWSKAKNIEHPEKFCHFSGEASNGDTSFKKPILKKNWKEAKKKFNF